MNSEQIVDILLEDEVDDFASSLPQGFFDTFHVIRDREGGVHADREYAGHYLVYKNNDGGTRDFYGYIQKDNKGWRVTGVKNPSGGNPRGVIMGHRYPTPDTAARELARRYYDVQQDYRRVTGLPE